MQRASKKKRFFIFLVFIIIGLEILLQSYSYFFVNEQRFFFGVDRRDHIISRDHLRIVALGESTTDNRYYGGAEGKAWPEFLEEMLVAEGIPVRMYNLGHPAITTNELLHELNAILDHYRPDIVISMLGVNDSNLWSIHLENHSLKKVKLYRLISWIYFSLRQEESGSKITIDYINNWSGLDEEDIAKGGRDHPGFSSLPLEKQAQLYAYWARSSYERIENAKSERREELIETYQLSLEHNIFVENILGDYSWLLCHEERFDECHNVFSRYIARGGKLNHFELMTAQCCAHEGDKWDHILSSNDKDMSFYYKKNAAFDNYGVIAEKIKQRGALHIVMQYPMVSIDLVRDYLGDERGLIYIENRDNFLSALEQHKREEIFTDMFAGEFGHTTDLGHQLIAKNLFESLKTKIKKLAKEKLK